MKKIITIIFCLLVSATMMGQDCLTFMGVPTEGSADEIIKQLEDKGFKLDSSLVKYGDNWKLAFRIMRGKDIKMYGMFCGEWCTVFIQPYEFKKDDIHVKNFVVQTHRHNNITKERAKNMYNSFKQHYNFQTFPSLHREVTTTILNKEGDQIGIVTFCYTSTRVQITYNNIKKPKKTFHKCDEHCDGYWG